MKNKLSIVTPSLNQGEFIESTIRSVLLQHYPEIEYIIIDGESTDKSIDVINSYDNQIDFWVSENDKGQTDAINKGWKRSTGAIFNWLNSDDNLAEMSLEIVNTKFNEENIDVLCGYSVIHYEEGGYLRKRTSNPSGDYIRFLSEGQIVQPSTFWRKEILDRYMPLPVDLHYLMDHFLFLSYVSQSGSSRIGYIDDSLAEISMHSAAKSVAHLDRFQEEMNWIFYHLYKSYDLEPPRFLNKGNVALSFVANNELLFNCLQELEPWLCYALLFRRDHKGKKVGLNFQILKRMNLNHIPKVFTIPLHKI